MTSKKSKYNYTSATGKQDQTPSLQPPQRPYYKREAGSYWRPFSLRLPFLALFGLTSFCLIPSLLILRHYADSEHGFGLITSNHYTWTYGPTAIFTILISLWRLIDYHCKALLPWAELAGGPVEAEKSILLDHVSPMILISLARAGKSRHYVVVLTILGFLMLKVVTLASTALFFPFTVTLGPSNVTMIQSTRFDNITNFTASRDPGPSPFYMTYAVVMRNYSLPEGVASNLVYESIRSVNDSASANTTYTASTGAFIPHVECDFVETELEIDLSQYTHVVVDVPLQFKIFNDTKWTCHNRLNREITVTSLPVAAQYLPPRQIIGSFGLQPCNPTAGSPEGTSAPILVALSDLRYSQEYKVDLTNHAYGDALRPVSWNFTIPTIRGMLCQTSYQLGSVKVSYNMSGTKPLIQVGENLTITQSLENFSNTSLANLLSYADPTMIGGGRDLFGMFADYAYVEQPPETIMELVAARAGNDYIYLLNNPDKMLKATEDILMTMMVSIASDLLLLQTNSTFRGNPVSGQKQYTSKRLQIQPESLYLMIGGISIVLLISIVVIFLRPKSTATMNLETTAAVAQMVGNSHDIQQQILQVSTLDEEIGQKALSHYKYYTPNLGGNVFMYRSSSTENNLVQKAIHPVQKFYSPMTIQKWFIVLTFSFAPIIIVLLEVLQRISDSSDGIISLEGDSSLVVSIYTRYLPALTMLLVATLFNSFDFNTSMLAPFNRMYSQPASSQTLIRPLIGQTPLIALYNAYRNRYWSALLTGIATIIGSVLTIVVSGLYSTGYVQNSTEMALHATDSFNVSFHQGTKTDNATAATSSLIESGILSYPAFTYDALVLPKLSISESGSSMPQSGTVTAQLPALQADLNCTDVRFSDLNFSVAYVSHYGDTMLSINGFIPLPADCELGSSNGNLSYIPYSYGPSSLDPISNTTYLGQFVDLHVGPYTEGIDSGEPDSPQPDNPPGCPSLALIYGYFDGNNSTNSIMTAKRCDQILGKLSTNVTINVPDLAFASDSPPIAMENTLEYISSGPDNTTAFWWRLESFFDYSLQILNSTTSNTVTGFFNAVLNGKTPLPIEALAAGSPVTTYTPDEMFAHILSFYRRYMAQYISANMRIPAPTSDTNSIVVKMDTVKGSFISSGGMPRMVQNHTPKLTLQIILAVMFICCVLAYYLGNYRDIVPWNPCMIAGVMVLVAGSRMCSSNTSLGEARVGDTASSQISEDGLEMSRLTSDQPGDALLDDSTDGPTLSPRTEMVDPSLSPTQARSSVDKEREFLKGNFRLGWWRGGNYMGTIRPPPEKSPSSGSLDDNGRNRHDSAEFENEARDYGALRYGIDMI